ncbi:MAG: hypothetical protein PHF35_01330 [Candidatus Moranbacteria bacterium]|nr:hypothetical protein [Candidatus Moranbacteria bacterium]
MSEQKKSPKKQIPFVEILKEAARIVWKNRFLVWFGLFLALGSPGSFNMGSNNSDELGSRGEFLRNYFESHWQIATALAVLMIIIGIILLLLSLIAKAGLVKSVHLISQNKKTGFQSGWKTGKKYFGKLFQLSVLFFLIIFVLVVVLAIPVVYLALNHSWVAAILVGVLAFAIFLPLIFVFSLTKAYSEFYIILSNLSIRSSIETGYDLLIGNLGNSIVFSLLIFAVSAAAFLVFLPVAGISLLILFPAGLLFYYLNKIAFGAYVALAALLFLGLILFLSSIFQTYKTAAWTLFFQEIAKVEKPETAEAAEETEKSIAAAPEKA